MDYQQKYLKYKNKYLTLKAQMGGKYTYVQEYNVYPQQICQVNDIDGGKYCNCPKYEKNSTNSNCKYCQHPDYLHNNYLKKYTETYVNKCEFGEKEMIKYANGEYGYGSFRYCNCPGFMSIDDTYRSGSSYTGNDPTSNLICVRCNHYKANHKK